MIHFPFGACNGKWEDFSVGDEAGNTISTDIPAVCGGAPLREATPVEQCPSELSYRSIPSEMPST